MKNLSLLFAALATAFISGCSSTPEAPAPTPAPSTAPATATPAPAAAADKPRMRGTYIYMADAAIFTDCATGKKFPVAMEKDGVALERAYLAARSAPGAPLLVTFDGQLTRRPKMEGSGDEEVVVVDKFEKAWPGEECAKTPGQGAAKLENTYWKLVELGGKPIKAGGRREPHLRLNPEGKAAQGSGGCNTFRGDYQLDGESLRLTRLISTRMACPDLEVEGTFLKALEAATSYKLAGEKLELYADGKLLARFEPR